MDPISLYCDGGCRGNQHHHNIGGWGALLLWGAHRKELNGAAQDTTNNKMELTACIEGLRAIKNKTIHTDVYVDSAYVHQGITSWVYGWMKKGWTNTKKEPVANKDLWIALLAEKQQFASIAFHKVKGHGTNAGNIRADALANEAMDAYHDARKR